MRRVKTIALAVLLSAVALTFYSIRQLPLPDIQPVSSTQSVISPVRVPPQLMPVIPLPTVITPIENAPAITDTEVDTPPLVELDIHNPPAEEQVVSSPNNNQLIFDQLKNQPAIVVLDEWHNALSTLESSDSPYDWIKFALADSLRRADANDEAYLKLRHLAIESQDDNHKILLADLLRETATPAALSILLEWATGADENLRPTLWQAIAGMGNNLWGGHFHPELSPLLEEVWRATVLDPNTLPHLAVALARVGAPQGVNILIQSIYEQPGSIMAQTARYALSELRNPDAIPTLKYNLSININTEVYIASGTALASMGDPRATQVLLDWAQIAPDSQNAQIGEWFTQLRDTNSIRIATECLEHCSFASAVVRNTLTHIITLTPNQ